jgi:hypothetical protein
MISKIWIFTCFSRYSSIKKSSPTVWKLRKIFFSGDPNIFDSGAGNRWLIGHFYKVATSDYVYNKYCFSYTYNCSVVNCFAIHFGRFRETLLGRAHTFRYSTVTSLSYFAAAITCDLSLCLRFTTKKTHDIINYNGQVIEAVILFPIPRHALNPLNTDLYFLC